MSSPTASPSRCAARATPSPCSSAGSTAGGPGTGVSGTGTVRYADGSSSPYRLTAPDWRAGPLTTKALALPRLNTPEGPRAEATRLYAVTVPVTRGKRITSLTLPDDPGPESDLHVFAASVRAEATGWTGSWAASTSGYTAVGPWTDRTLRLVVRSRHGRRPHPRAAGQHVRRVASAVRAGDRRRAGRGRRDREAGRCR